MATPIPVQKLRDAQTLADSLSPSTLSEAAAAAPLPDDGLTNDEKMLAMSSKWLWFGYCLAVPLERCRV